MESMLTLASSKHRAYIVWTRFPCTQSCKILSNYMKNYFIQDVSQVVRLSQSLLCSNLYSIKQLKMRKTDILRTWYQQEQRRRTTSWNATKIHCSTSSQVWTCNRELNNSCACVWRESVHVSVCVSERVKCAQLISSALIIHCHCVITRNNIPMYAIMYF